MLGAIIGDMVGSIYEFHPIKTKKFDICDERMFMTDDSLLTMAVAWVLLRNLPLDYSEEGLRKLQDELVDAFVKTVERYPDAGWGNSFYAWARKALYRGIKEPYGSYGNGAAMRISPVGYIARSEEEVKILSKAITEITHNSGEGIKGAEAVAMCVYLARKGKSKEEIFERVAADYYPEIARMSIKGLIDHYEFDETCQGSCPQAIYCFLASDSLEDALRNCVAIGGDCDTTGAMAGAIAEAYYSKGGRSEFEERFIASHIDPSVVELYEALLKASE